MPGEVEYEFEHDVEASRNGIARDVEDAASRSVATRAVSAEALDGPRAFRPSAAHRATTEDGPVARRVEHLLLELATASLRADLAAIAATGRARAAHELAAETARALHVALEPTLAGGRPALVLALERAARMRRWLTDRASTDATASAARDVVAGTYAALRAALRTDAEQS